MADYNNITRLSELDDTTPAGSEVPSKIDDAIRQIKNFLKTYLGVSLDDTGALKSGASSVTSIPNSSVTYAKIQNVSATDKVLGRASAGTGVVEEIACTAAGRAIIDDVDAAAQRTTLGLGAMAVKASVGTTDIDAAAVTTAKIAPLAVTASELAANAVTNAKLAALSVSPDKFTNVGDAKVIAGDGTSAAALTVGGALTATRSGSTLVFALSGGSTSGVSATYALLEERPASGTHGGASTASTYVARTLTEQSDAGDLIGVGGSTITVKKKGTYIVRGWSAAYSVGSHRCRLRQVSGTVTDLLLGSSEAAPPGVMSRSDFAGVVTFPDDNLTVQLQHWCELTVATNGLGLAVASGESEVFAQIEFIKV